MTWETTRISDMLSRHEQQRDVLDAMRSMSFSTHRTADSYDTRATTGTSVALGLAHPPTMRNHISSGMGRVAEEYDYVSPRFQESPIDGARPLSSRDRTMLVRDDTFSVDGGSVFGDEPERDSARATKGKEPAQSASKTRFRKAYPEYRQESSVRVDQREPVLEQREPPEDGPQQLKSKPQAVKYVAEPVVQKETHVEAAVAKTEISAPKPKPITPKPKLSTPNSPNKDTSARASPRKKAFTRGNLLAMEDLLQLVTRKRSEIVESTRADTATRNLDDVVQTTTEEPAAAPTPSGAILRDLAPETLDDESIEAASIEASIEDPTPATRMVNAQPSVQQPVPLTVNSEPPVNNAPCSPRSQERKAAVRARLRSFMDTHKQKKERGSRESREEPTSYSYGADTYSRAGDTYTSQGRTFTSVDSQTIDSNSLSDGNWLRENSMIETEASTAGTQMTNDQDSRSVSDIRNDALGVPTSSGQRQSESNGSEKSHPEPIELSSDPAADATTKEKKSRADTPIVRSTRRIRRLVRRIWSCKDRSAPDDVHVPEAAEQRTFEIFPTGTPSIDKQDPPSPTSSLLRRRIKPKLVDLDTSSEEESVEAVAVFTPGSSNQPKVFKTPLSPIQEEVGKLLRGAKAASVAAKDMLLFKSGNTEFCGLCTPENGFYPKEMRVHKRRERTF